MRWPSLRRGVAAACLALGCALLAPSEPPLECGRLLVAPVNFNQRLPDELEENVPVMQVELERYLEERQCRVVALPRERFRTLWAEKASAVKSLYRADGGEDPERYDRAVGLVLPALRGGFGDFDALVIPYLALRPAKQVGRAIYWDGVKRTVEEGSKRWVTGLSIRAIVFRADGARAGDGYGGLEPLELSEDARRWTAPPNLLLQRDHVQEGVREALRPYLGG